MKGIGIVHFGPGAFHRAHQADYIDRILMDDPQWAIAAVSLRSAATVEALKRQQGRYTLAIIDQRTDFRTLQAHKAFIGPSELQTVRRMLQDPAVRLVSCTVTEKGYCLTGDGVLDFDHPDIIHDLANPLAPISIVGWLALGLADRRAAGQPAFTPLCCDNMASNGKKLRSAVIAYAERLDRQLPHWIAGEVAFPDTMVDSITPATDERLRALVFEQTGSNDEIPVSREAYSAWIIEDVLPAGSPDLRSVGVTMSLDVGAWEKAKLRILNGAHSALAYLGLLIGHETVADAMADTDLASFVERLIREEVVPSLKPSPLNLDVYATEILARFRNPSIGHKLSQIAWDGSQKLPYRLLDTLLEARAMGRRTRHLVVSIAAWMAFVERQVIRGLEIVDPLSEALVAACRSGDPGAALLSLHRIFPQRLAADPGFRSELAAATARLNECPRTTLAGS